MSIDHQETFGAVQSALANSSYVRKASLIAGMAALVEKARLLGMTDQEIDADFRAVMNALPGDEERLFGR